ncbi:arylsulfatase [Flammeovirga sp. MY04]|uniref:N-acetylgalactosamine-6-sulfate sulfatase n=2 Tax=Flammeovirga TaxID=59739 RepID=D0PR10_9BACT|nr:N-acetylgalactosamine-6-sulfate sulfatase [Flammeovirga yaeyamensis]ANQ51448.2 arylsulfatase [Flammeovirga sp. MY04]
MMMKYITRSTIVLLVFFSFLYIKSCSDIDKPNVIIILTDDMGYGDIAAHGNKDISTPHIDQLHDESLRLTNFHVNPTCAPSRSALMTGKDANRVGVWHTVMGRSLLYEEEETMADIFSANNYATGLFGKWHLGDNYPFAPQYRGFQEVLTHGGGGVGQTPDYWNNDYFDDVYLRNGQEEKFEGYCTDVWFREALTFIKENKENPFLCYISTNAPHTPLNVPSSYAEPYLKKGIQEDRAKFYGMISNIDDNIGLLRKKLEEWGIADNTILIFMSDNGTANGATLKGKQLLSGYNANMRGVKGSPYDGGHRVPFYVYWKNGNLNHGMDINQLTAHIDVLPTLIKMCGLSNVPTINFDGIDLSQIFLGSDENLDVNRILIGDSQRLETPKKWRNSYVMMGQWRLINGTELYNLKRDPSQVKNVFDLEHQIVKQLKEAYEKHWAEISPSFHRFAYIKLGNDVEKISKLTAHDWHVEEQHKIPWNQQLIRKGQEGTGHWKVNFVKEGKYKIVLSRWPKEVNLPLNAQARPFYSDYCDYHLEEGKKMEFTNAYLTVGNKTWEQKVQPNASSVSFDVELRKGETEMTASFKTSDNVLQGAYYVYVEKLGMFKSI